MPRVRSCFSRPLPEGAASISSTGCAASVATNPLPSSRATTSAASPIEAQTVKGSDPFAVCSHFATLTVGQASQVRASPGPCQASAAVSIAWPAAVTPVSSARGQPWGGAGETRSIGPSSMRAAISAVSAAVIAAGSRAITAQRTSGPSSGSSPGQRTSGFQPSSLASVSQQSAERSAAGNARFSRPQTADAAGSSAVSAKIAINAACGP